MMTERTVHTVEVAGLKRDLPLFEIAPGVRIAILNILGDVELVQAAARALAGRLAPISPSVLVTAETKSIPLIYALAVEMHTPYVVFRKTYKPYMGNALSAETQSITTGSLQTLYLDEKDRALLSGQPIALVDDVISTGSTLQAMRHLAQLAGAAVVAEAAIFTEGDSARWSNVIALGHLPIFTDSKSG
jgi:adenine phosphoribosyltransferase